jgi:hypothetical protein
VTDPAQQHGIVSSSQQPVRDFFTGRETVRLVVRFSPFSVSRLRLHAFKKVKPRPKTTRCFSAHALKAANLLIDERHNRKLSNYFTQIVKNRVHADRSTAKNAQ